MTAEEKAAQAERVAQRQAKAMEMADATKYREQPKPSGPTQ